MASVKYVVHMAGCPAPWDQRVEQQWNVLVLLREATVRFYCRECTRASGWEQVVLPQGERLLEWPV